MRLGVHLPQFREPVAGAVLADAARDAEEAGADDLWVSDHLLLPAGSERPPESFHDPLTVLTWAAATTRRAGLGTSVLVAPYRHPVVLAKALASLDALSDGRVIAGMASGWLESEFAALGVPFRERGRRTDAAVATCRALWSGDEVDGNRLLPPPARPGGPPVWIGGDGDAGVRRAARLGDAWHTTVSDPVRLRERLGALDRALERAGRARRPGRLGARAGGCRAGGPARAGPARAGGAAPAGRSAGGLRPAGAGRGDARPPARRRALTAGTESASARAGIAAFPQVPDGNPRDRGGRGLASLAPGRRLP